MTSNRMLRQTLCSVAALLAASAFAQPGDDAVKAGVAMIKAGDRFGAGIIFAIRNDRIYIVTANHVVRDSGNSIRVSLWNRSSQQVNGILYRQVDSALDVAVVVVDGAASLGYDSSSLKWDRLGRLSDLKAGTHVHLLGNPQAKAWILRVTADPVVSADSDRIVFESSGLFEGHSGGALLNEAKQLVGMIREEFSGDRGAAVPMPRIVDLLNSWGLPVDLTPGASPPAPSNRGRDTHTVLVRRTKAFIDNRSVGELRASTSSVEFRVPDARLKHRHDFDEPWQDQSMSLATGTHEFEFEADVDLRGGGSLRGTCKGFIEIKGPAQFTPFIKLGRGGIEKCELRPIK